jgi:hypothetical protein
MKRRANGDLRKIECGGSFTAVSKLVGTNTYKHFFKVFAPTCFMLDLAHFSLKLLDSLCQSRPFIDAEVLVTITERNYAFLKSRKIGGRRALYIHWEAARTFCEFWTLLSRFGSRYRGAGQDLIGFWPTFESSGMYSSFLALFHTLYIHHNTRVVYCKPVAPLSHLASCSRGAGHHLEVSCPTVDYLGVYFLVLAHFPALYNHYSTRGLYCGLVTL